MTTTTNLSLTQLEVGQVGKEATINGNMQVIDAKMPIMLGEFSTAPTTTGKAPGSTYYNTSDSKVYFLRANGTWVALN